MHAKIYDLLSGNWVDVNDASGGGRRSWFTNSLFLNSIKGRKFINQTYSIIWIGDEKTDITDPHTAYSMRR